MKRLVLIMALVCSSCTAHMVKDVNGNQRLKWSTPTVVGYSLGLTGIVTGTILGIDGITRDREACKLSGTVIGIVGLVTVAFTALTSGIVFDEAPAPLPVSLSPQPAQ